MSAFVPRSRVRVVGRPRAVAPRSDDIRERGIESRRRFVDPMPRHEGTFLPRPTLVVGLRTDTAIEAHNARSGPRLRVPIGSYGGRASCRGLEQTFGGAPIDRHEKVDEFEYY